MRLLGFTEDRMSWLPTGNLGRRGACARGAPIFLQIAALAVTLGASASWGQEVDAAQKQLLNGHYEKVAETAWKKIHEGSYVESWRVLLVESQLALGRYAEANSNAVTAVDEFPGN